jgi:hypothetical protein
MNRCPTTSVAISVTAALGKEEPESLNNVGR